MQVVCEATQNASVNVQVGAFECLVLIMEMYYDKMGSYMEQALFWVRVVYSLIYHYTILTGDDS
jgi:importin subunit beta-1